jgi:hypothetical protein
MSSRPGEPPARRWYRLPGLRSLFGPDRAAWQIAGLVYLAVWTLIAIIGRPDLMHPTEIGTDPSNYYAAGLRLNAGHALYAVVPGDRMVPIDPPFFTAPLLSPPPIAVLWRLLAVLPGDVVMTAWSAIGGLMLVVSAVWLVSRLSLPAASAMLITGPMVAITIWSGNVQAYLTVSLVIAWLAHERGRPEVTGAIAGIAAAIKLTPILLLPWFLARRDWRGASAMVVALCAVGAVSLLGAGLDNHVAYLEVARQTSLAGPTPGSLPDVLHGLGVPMSMASLAPAAAMLGGILGSLVLRDRAGIGFAVALVAGIYSTPVVHPVTLAFLLPALTPFRARSLGRELLRPDAETTDPVLRETRPGAPSPR